MKPAPPVTKTRMECSSQPSWLPVHHSGLAVAGERLAGARGDVYDPQIPAVHEGDPGRVGGPNDALRIQAGLSLGREERPNVAAVAIHDKKAIATVGALERSESLQVGNEVRLLTAREREGWRDRRLGEHPRLRGEPQSRRARAGHADEVEDGRGGWVFKGQRPSMIDEVERPAVVAPGNPRHPGPIAQGLQRSDLKHGREERILEVDEANAVRTRIRHGARGAPGEGRAPPTVLPAGVGLEEHAAAGGETEWVEGEQA